MGIDINSIENGKPRLKEITAALLNPEVTAKLEPGGVSGGGRKIRKSNCYLIVI